MKVMETILEDMEFIVATYMKFKERYKVLYQFPEIQITHGWVSDDKGSDNLVCMLKVAAQYIEEGHEHVIIYDKEKHKIIFNYNEEES